MLSHAGPPRKSLKLDMVCGLPTKINRGRARLDMGKNKGSS